TSNIYSLSLHDALPISHCVEIADPLLRCLIIGIRNRPEDRVSGVRQVFVAGRLRPQCTSGKAGRSEELGQDKALFTGGVGADGVEPLAWGPIGVIDVRDEIAGK